MRRHRRAVAIASVTALALVLGGGGTVVAYQAAHRSSTVHAQPGFGGGQNGWRDPSTQGGQGFGGSGRGSSGASTSSSATTATAAQQVGVVTIVTTVQYGQGEAAGTGMILSSDGEILTNNHVVEGATSIEVTVESTGRTYAADVVGTDPTEDVAVLKLANASGLTAIDLSDDAAQVGDTVTDVGNAGGTGTLVAASGTVTDLDQRITVQDEVTGAGKTLDGLIELSADIQSGDSGGPVLDADGDVVGIATAASSGSADVTGYAIPIATAEAVVRQIESGVETDTVQLGLPAFLGVQLSQQSVSAGVGVSGTIQGSGAEAAGLEAGDTITAVDGEAVADSPGLSAIIAQHQPGDRIAVTYTDAAGTSHTATVTLGEGPAA